LKRGGGKGEKAEKREERQRNATALFLRPNWSRKHDCVKVLNRRFGQAKKKTKKNTGTRGKTE